jgi:hypothetical protein
VPLPADPRSTMLEAEAAALQTLSFHLRKLMALTDDRESVEALSNCASTLDLRATDHKVRAIKLRADAKSLDKRSQQS